jgi:hypothetical protein
VICPRCGARCPDSDPDCPSCGRPTVTGGPDEAVAARPEPVLEPEVLESLDEAERTRLGHGPQARHVGCSLGPGCGCLGLPFAVLAGVAISSLVALLWVLSLGRVPASLIRLAKQARRGFHRS